MGKYWSTSAKRGGAELTCCSLAEHLAVAYIFVVFVVPLGIKPSTLAEETPHWTVWDT